MRKACSNFVLLMLMMQLVSCTGSCSEKKEAAIKDTLPSIEKQLRDPSIAGNFSAQTSLRFDSSELIVFLDRFPEFKDHRKELLKFYQKRAFAYAWFDRNGLIEPSMDLYYRIINITDEGLPIDIPYLKEYRQMIEGDSSRDPVRDAQPGLEIMISAQYFHYAREAWSGLPESTSRAEEWYIPRVRLNYETLLDSVVSEKAGNRNIIEPLPRQYGLLKEYLKKLRQMELTGEWVTIRSDKRKYVLGDSSSVIRDIRKKLFLSGDLLMHNDSPVFDTALMEGVKHFQKRYGMKSDGVVGVAVFKEMNTPLAVRIRQILVNMERSRWLGTDPKGDHLVVNIPEFELHVYEADTMRWSCRVVVGKEANKTAIFQSKLQYIVFSPYWNVPPGILVKEILPALRRNPNYLQRQDMEWFGDGIRQRPGSSNALGRVKFLFPNSFNMYLHDTPAKSLFEQDRRAFSHGCIRVAEPRRLALHLLKNDPEWTEARIDAAMNAGKERFVTLKKKIPVSIVYFTTWVDDRGNIHFRDDIYKRDERLMEMIFLKK